MNKMFVQISYVIKNNEFCFIFKVCINLGIDDDKISHYNLLKGVFHKQISSVNNITKQYFIKCISKYSF
jgi:hypothetical protein